MNKKYIISLVLFLVFFPIVSATDWTIGNPTGLGYTNYVTDQFLITNNNATNGTVLTYNLQNGGAYTSTSIFNNCNMCLYALVNPIDNTRWGTDEAGNVFYTTQASPVDYSAGFYTSGITGTCYSLGGNCNNLHRATTLTASNTNRKLTFDSDGNIYVADGSDIYKIVKSFGYSPQLFYTLVSGLDYKPAAQAALEVHVLGIQADSSNNIHMLIGTRSTGAAIVRSGYLSKTMINNVGVHVSADIGIRADGCGATGAAGILYGGFVIDPTNPTQNFTYGYKTTCTPSNFYLIHNSSTGNATISALAGITDISDIGYYNYQIYLSSPTQNLVRSYVTNYQGYGFAQIPTNEDGITGTFTWVNGYGSSISTTTPGAALAYRWTISNQLSNYTFFSGWGTDTQTEPSNMRDLTELTGLGIPATFNTNSNDLAGSSIYGYLLARRNNDSTWSILSSPQILTIQPATVGYDSITLDKSFYNLTGDTINAAITYGSGWPYIYKWQLCTRADCADGQFFNQISLAAFQSTSSMGTDGLKAGNYYAVLMKHIAIFDNEIVASQRFEVRPPVITVAWDKTSYNLFPKSQISTCIDATPSYFPWTNVTGYAGLQRGWFSCSTTPPEANANNSIMRGSLYARYNGTFYLNNSLGNVWNGTLSNGSGALIYTLTNSSVTGTWTLVGVNNSSETYYANVEVDAESSFGYSLSVSPNIAYNQDTLYMTFTKPIWIFDFVVLKDAGGTTLFASSGGQTSGTYYIDPSKQYTYGTWTAYWNLGSVGSVKTQGQHIYTFTVKNSGRPKTNNSVVPENTGTEITKLLSSKIFWALLFIVGIMLAVAVKERGGK